MSNNLKPWIVVFAVIILIGVSCMNANKMITLPDEIHNWKNADTDLGYNRTNLYDYINGGAELYLSYGFKEMFGRTYSREGQPDIIVDIFDMGESRSAFGIFTFSREAIDDRFGQGSQYTEGLLLFWKDRYYISILASPETAESKEAVFSLADQIDESIALQGSLPAVLDLLPKDGLRRSSVRYFYHHVWLNTYYYIADDNIFNINDNTEAVIARYRHGESSPLLLIVQYANEDLASEAFGQFIDSYLPELKNMRAVRIEDGTYSGADCHKNIIRAVFNAADEDSVLKLLEQL